MQVLNQYLVKPLFSYKEFKISESEREREPESALLSVLIYIHRTYRGLKLRFSQPYIAATRKKKQ